MSAAVIAARTTGSECPYIPAVYSPSDRRNGAHRYHRANRIHRAPYRSGTDRSRGCFECCHRASCGWQLRTGRGFRRGGRHSGAWQRREPRAEGRRRSTKLAVFAAAPVIAGDVRVITILGVLTGHAQPSPRQRLAARLGNLRAAFRAMRRRRPCWQAALRPLIPSSTVASICSCTAPSPAQPVAMFVLVSPLPRWGLSFLYGFFSLELQAAGSGPYNGAKKCV